MFKRLMTLLSLFLSVASFAQTDTVSKKGQRGYLFISPYNYQYDYSGGHMRPVGFHDYFFPSDKMDTKQFLDSTKKLTFSNGIRIDFFPGRYYFKTHSQRFAVWNNINCYHYDSLYVVAVVMDFKEYTDNWPPVCDKNTYQVQVIKGSNIDFIVLPRAMIVRDAREQKRKTK